MKKIRNLKVHLSTQRREKTSEKNQPPHKKRKISREEYKRVEQDNRRQVKREDEDNKE